jgi:hypothetical protein
MIHPDQLHYWPSSTTRRPCRKHKGATSGIRRKHTAGRARRSRSFGPG